MLPQKIESRIYEIRKQKVMPDFDLAELYGIETKRLKEAVRRNIERFPQDFMFELTPAEHETLRTQIATSNRGGRRYFPFAFTEQGVAMLSSVLNSPTAIEINISIMRAFVMMREYALTHKELTDKLKLLEKRFNKKFKDVYDAIDSLKKDKLSTDQQQRKRIGFKKEY